MVGLRWAAGVGGLLLTLVSFVPPILRVAWAGWPFVPALAVQLMIALAAALLLAVPRWRVDGWWLVAATVATGLSALANDAFEDGYWIQLSFGLVWAAGALLVPPFLRFPAQPAPTWAVRALAIAALVVLVGVRSVSSLFWDPVTMAGYTGPSRWVTPWPWEAAARGMPAAVPWLLLPVVVAFTWLQALRVHRAAGPTRRVVLVLAWLSSLMAWWFWVRVLVEIVPLPDEADLAVTLGHLIFTTAAFVAVILVALGVPLRRARFVDDLLTADGRPQELQAVLRRHTLDPTLRLRFWTDEGWVDADGHPCDGDAPDRPRHAVVVEGGRPVVEAEVDPRLDLADTAVVGMLDAAGVVLARARLSVQQAAQAQELRASRARIVEAGVHQRRRLERDLHDGAQQHLLAAQAALSRAELLQEAGEAPGPALADVRAKLASTMAELRGLARGLHPALLSQAGLVPALASLTDLSGRVRVETGPDLAGRRFTPLVEATLWFVASEAVVNALKHTDADVLVRAGVADGAVVCRVSDDGPGGAVVTTEGGLGGLRDRVRAAGGSFDLASGPTGTTLEVRLPAREGAGE